MNDKFGLWEKWFWIGIVVSIFNVVAGVVYGIALVVEREHRKEGLIIICWAIIWTLISFFVIGPLLLKSGILPKFRLEKV